MQAVTLPTFALKSMCFTAPVLMIQSATINPGDFNWISQVERTGLLGALMLAVIVLWKSNTEKDKQLAAMVEHLTATSVSQVETNRELRKIIEESVRTKQDLKLSIDTLARSLEGK